MSDHLVLSLFPGLDMLGMAFEGEGYCVVAGPDVVWGRDVREFHPPAGRFDGLIGGDPCQSHSSLANLVRAKGLEPTFGDLSGEYQRVVEEARPAWFLRENVPAAPDIAPAGYAVHSFLLDNAWLDSGDGFGEEQMRRRRFWFGVRGAAEPVDLRRWIKMAALELPSVAAAATSGPAGFGSSRSEPDSGRPTRKHAVVADQRCVPVARGGSGKVKRTVVTGGNGHAPGQRRKTSEVLEERARVKRTAASCDGRTGHRTNEYRGGYPPVREGEALAPRRRAQSVTGRHDGEIGKTGGHRGSPGRYTLDEMMRLQGLDPAALEHAPFTAQAKRKLVGNGVPLSMGRSLARAVRNALEALSV